MLTSSQTFDDSLVMPGSMTVMPLEHAFWCFGCGWVHVKSCSSPLAFRDTKRTDTRKPRHREIAERP